MTRSSAGPTAHHHLGIIYRYAGYPKTALVHYQEAVNYRNRCGDLFGVGQTNYNVALALATDGQLANALLYAQAALNCYMLGGTEATAEIDEARRLIAQIEQDLAAKGRPPSS